METEKDPMESIIKQYLERHGVMPYTIGMNLLAECISFWMDTNLEKLLQVTQYTTDQQAYNSNLYVDLAILHDGCIRTVMQYMCDSLPDKQGEPLNPGLLNCFVIKSIVYMQNLFRNQESVMMSAQIIPFLNKRNEIGKMKRLAYQKVTEKG